MWLRKHLTQAMQPSSRAGDPFHIARSTLAGLAVQAYLWISDRVYGRHAWAFEALTTALTAGRFPTWRRSALAHLPADGVLDLACGTGALLRELPTDSNHLVGVDLSPRMGLVFRQRTPHATFVCASADRLPFGSASFRAVVTTFPTRFLLAPQTLREVARVLGADVAEPRSGRLVVVGVFLTSRHRLIQDALSAIYGAPVAALLSAFTEAVNAAGFDLTDVEQPTGWIHPTLHVAVRHARRPETDDGHDAL